MPEIKVSKVKLFQFYLSNRFKRILGQNSHMESIWGGMRRYIMNNEKSIKAKIIFTVDMQHPDIEYIKDPTKTFEYEDTYFDTSFQFDDLEQFESYVKSDLAIIAGGGYNSEHIHNVAYEIHY